MITDNDNKIKKDMKYIHINDSDTFEWVVNACMKSRIHGSYILRNGWTIPAGNIEPATYAGHFTYKMIIASSSTLWLTSRGTLRKNSQERYDVVGFQID